MIQVEVMDCGDNSCVFAIDVGGMRTNGGCRCLRVGEVMTVELSRRLRSHAVEAARRVREAERPALDRERGNIASMLRSYAVHDTKRVQKVLCELAEKISPILKESP